MILRDRDTTADDFTPLQRLPDGLADGHEGRIPHRVEQSEKDGLRWHRQECPSRFENVSGRGLIVVDLLDSGMTEPNAEFPNLQVFKHPLIQHKLTWMRDETTSYRAFRALLS